MIKNYILLINYYYMSMNLSLASTPHFSWNDLWNLWYWWLLVFDNLCLWIMNNDNDIMSHIMININNSFSYIYTILSLNVIYINFDIDFVLLELTSLLSSYFHDYIWIFISSIFFIHAYFIYYIFITIHLNYL